MLLKELFSIVYISLRINTSIAFQNRKYFSRQNTQNTTQMFDVGEMGHGDEVLRYYKNYYKALFM